MKQISIILPVENKPKFWEPTTTAISSTLIDVLSNVSFVQTKKGWLVEIPELESDDYQAFRRILKALRGRYEIGGRHYLDFDARDLLAEVVSVGKLPKLNPFQLHQTPAEVVNKMLELCPLDFVRWKIKEKRPVQLLEPSAGLGAIAEPLRAALPGARLDLFEIDYLNRRVLQEKGFSIAGCDWLAEAEATNGYDLILMNPEFRGEAYLRHIEKALDCLKVGGFLATIVPVGFLSSNSALANRLRETFAEHCWGIEPIGSPFEGINTECLIVYGERLRYNEIVDRRSAVYDGYTSRLHHRAEICLDSDRKWHEGSKSAGLSSVAELENLAADHLLRLMAEQLVFLSRSPAVCHAIAASRHQELVENANC